MRNSKIMRQGLALATSITLGVGVLGVAPAVASEDELPAPGRVSTVPTPNQPDIDNIEHLYPGARKEHFIRTRDNVRIHVWEYGKSARQADTVIMTGGYPWTSSGLDVFARILATKYHVVRYDHRASGKSGHPEEPYMYKLERVADEMYDVIRATTAGKNKVHVFGEAWCPFIASQVAHQYPGSIRTITSLGAPSIDMAGNIYARDMENGDLPAKLAGKRQMAALWYIWLMRGSGTKKPSPVLKGLRKVLLESGLVPSLLNAPLGFMAGDFVAPSDWKDMRYGVHLYREGFVDHWEKPAYDYLNVPVVHFVHMANDPIETEYLVKGLEKRVPHYIRHDIKSDHLSWVTYLNTLIDYVHQSVSTYHRLHPNARW